MKTLVLRERGQGTVEYAFLLMIIALVVIVVLALVHNQSIPEFATSFLAVADPLGAEPPPPGTLEQTTHKIVEIIKDAAGIAVLVTAAILMIYAAMHMNGSDHTGIGK